MKLELKQVLGSTWCLMSQVLMPVYLTDEHHCILLDTGTALEKLRDAIEAVLAGHELTPVGVLCTHCHFDHAGNAAYFQQKYGIPVAMPIGEAEQCRNPFAIKSYLYVYTHDQIHEDETLDALPCTVDELIYSDAQSITFCGVEFRVLHTPGHSIDHCSYITPDGVCYVGDAIMSEEELSGAKLPYSYHMPSYLASIDLLQRTPCTKLIIAHCGILDYDPESPIWEDNRRAILDRLAQVSALIDHPMTMDEIFRTVQAALHIRVTTVPKAQAMERFLRPYLETMVDSGTHMMCIKDGVAAYAPAGQSECDHDVKA